MANDLSFLYVTSSS